MDAIKAERRMYLHLFYCPERALEDEKAFNSKLADLQENGSVGSSIRIMRRGMPNILKGDSGNILFSLLCQILLQPDVVHVEGQGFGLPGHEK
ncbi:MAG: hypothetical protein R6U46_15075, partial [Marinilabilia sp.]